MTAQMSHRLIMGANGAAAGLAAHLLHLVMEGDLLGARLALALMAFAVVHFTAVLALTGPLRPGQALIAAAGLGLGISGLLSLAALRFAEVQDVFDSPAPLLSAAILTFVALPFLIAAFRRRGRDYAVLFEQAWSIVIRYAAAWLFVGVAWLVIFLSDVLLSLVGLDWPGGFVTRQPAALVVTGLVLGLALAVVNELSDLLSPDLLLRLLRLLVLPVSLVMALFLLVLPLAGLEGVFTNISAAATLLAIVGLAVTLVSAALGHRDAGRFQSPWIEAPARALAAMTVLPAALAVWAVAQRVGQYGWTPDRVQAACAAAIGLGYGLVYLAAVLRGPGWQARIRRGNIAMAALLALMLVALLTPVIDPQAVSARSQLARLADGRLTAETIDLEALSRWGRAGVRARDELVAIAEGPGQEVLARRLQESPANPATLPDLDDASLRARIAGRLPLRPADAGQTRDAVLDMLWTEELRHWAETCDLALPDGRPRCVMLVGDFWPHAPGPEALVLLAEADGNLQMSGFATAEGGMMRLPVSAFGAALPRAAAAQALLAALQDRAEPPLAPAPLLALTFDGLVLMPQP